MSENWQKYLLKQPVSFRKKLLIVVKKLRDFNFKGLDIKKIHGLSDGYRCRIGKFRVLFKKEKDFVIIIDINTRGDIYK